MLNWINIYKVHYGNTFIIKYSRKKYLYKQGVPKFDSKCYNGKILEKLNKILFVDFNFKQQFLRYKYL